MDYFVRLKLKSFSCINNDSHGTLEWNFIACRPSLNLKVNFSDLVTCELNGKLSGASRYELVTSTFILYDPLSRVYRFAGTGVVKPLSSYMKGDPIVFWVLVFRTS